MRHGSVLQDEEGIYVGKQPVQGSLSKPQSILNTTEEGYLAWGAKA